MTVGSFRHGNIAYGSAVMSPNGLAAVRTRMRVGCASSNHASLTAGAINGWRAGGVDRDVENPASDRGFGAALVSHDLLSWLLIFDDDLALSPDLIRLR
jgi:hypothetical protein